MKRSEIRQAVIDHTGRDDKEDVINRAINLGLEEMVQRHHFRDLWKSSDIDIEDGDKYVELPEDTLNVLEARITDGDDVIDRPLKLRHKLWVVSRFPNRVDDSKGRPWLAWEEGLRLHLVPISDGSYTVKVTTIYKPELSSDSEENPIRATNNVLIAYATSYLYSSIEKTQDAQAWHQRFEMGLRDAIRLDKRGQPNTPHADVLENYPSHPEPWKDPFAKGDY